MDEDFITTGANPESVHNGCVILCSFDNFISVIYHPIGKNENSLFQWTKLLGVYVEGHVQRGQYVGATEICGELVLDLLDDSIIHFFTANKNVLFEHCLHNLLLGAETDY